MYDINSIKDRISVIDYAKTIGLPVRRSGDRCVSPLRSGATNPTSFYVTETYFYDFASAVGGDVIELCALYEFDGDRGKAIRKLAQLTGIKSNSSDEWVEYTKHMNSMTAYYQDSLTDEHRNYLHSRGLRDADISRLKIGTVADGSLKGRLFLPYMNNGYVCYYATRSMPGSSHPNSKYMKQKKDDYCQHIPWGMQTLDRDSDTLIIAEGYFDAVSFEIEGYPVLSAITGSFSSSQLETVYSIAKRFSKVLIVYDNDTRTKAGAKFTARMAKLLAGQNINFVVGAVPSEYKDISEYYADGGRLQSIVSSAKPGIAYISSLFTDIDDLTKFIMPIARHTNAAKLSSYLASTQFDSQTVKELIRMAKSCPSEETIAQEITDTHQLIYVPNDAFYEWNGVVWERTDDLTIQGYAIHYYGKQFATSQRGANVMRFLKATLKTDILMNRKQVMTFRNGTLEVDTATFREHSPSDYISQLLDYDYDQDARCPRWEQFIDEITANDSRRAALLQEIAGYILFPDCRLQKIFCLIGDGSNGKSVYLSMLEAVFGSHNCTYIDPANFTNEFWLIHLKDSLLNFATEIGTDFSRSEATLKMLSDGTTMQACYKGQNHITFRSRAKLVFACNAIPRTQTIAGMERRMHFINFPVRFCDYPEGDFQLPKDVNLMPTLMKELPGIFNWCLDGYGVLLSTNQFTDTLEQGEYLTEFRQASNPVELFLTDYECGDYITANEFYSQYRAWCEDTGHKALANNTFSRSVMTYYGSRVEKTKRYINGQQCRVFQFIR